MGLVVEEVGERQDEWKRNVARIEERAVDERFAKPLRRQRRGVGRDGRVGLGALAAELGEIRRDLVRERGEGDGRADETAEPEPVADQDMITVKSARGGGAVGFPGEAFSTIEASGTKQTSGCYLLG